jgi:hypothetical protein
MTELHRFILLGTGMFFLFVLGVLWLAVQLEKKKDEEEK